MYHPIQCNLRCCGCHEIVESCRSNCDENRLSCICHFLIGMVYAVLVCVAFEEFVEDADSFELLEGGCCLPWIHWASVR